MFHSSRRVLTLLVATMLLALLPRVIYTAPAVDSRPAASAPLALQGEPLYYTVQAGDTLIRIAGQFGTTVSEIVRLNNLANPNLIYVGQRLLIREGGGPPPPPGPTPIPTPPPPPPPPPTGQTTYTVRAGDTLSAIAVRFGTTVQAIMAANNLSNPNFIYVGQVLIIPGEDDGGGPPPPPPPTGSTAEWGIQAQLLNQDLGRITGAANDMNLRWLKQQVRWADFEATPGVIEWGPLDTVANSAGEYKLLFSVLAAPGWARPAGTDPTVVGPPADPATYANFVGQLASRYCGKVQAIEVWNEQNLAREWGNETLSAARYMDLLRAAYPAIKNACSSITVVSGALTPTGAPPPAAVDDFTYLTQMYQNGLRQYTDAIGVHPSGYNVPPTLYYTQACAFLRAENARFLGPCDTPHHSWTFLSTLEGTRNIMVQNGDSAKKLWLTEFGWAVGEGTVPDGYQYALDNTREEQALWSSQAFSIGRDRDYVGTMILWNMNFADVAPGSEQALWSIYRQGYSPTISVPAIRDTPR